MVGRPTDRFVRWASLVGFPELCRSLGLDPAQLLADVGLRLQEPVDQDAWIPGHPVALVLERAAVASGCDDFAVRLNRWRRFSHLGPISLVLREEPDLRSALELLLRYQKAYNGVIDLRLAETDDLATLQVWVDYGRPVPVRQPLDLTMATLMTTIRTLVSPAWEPQVLYFSHPAPSDLSAFHAVFGPRLRFDHEFTGVVFPSRDLDAATVTADPGFRPYARQLLQSLPAPRAATVADEVGSLVEFLLPLGSSTMARVSRDLGVQSRTLHRRLVAEGQSFSAIVQTTRARLGMHYLANERYSLTEISGLLGFAAPSAFSTWFRQHFGTSASQWRSRPGPALVVDGPAQV
jgi:AraC-like DNA-binding protein